jgi:hypothetical protein
MRELRREEDGETRGDNQENNEPGQAKWGGQTEALGRRQVVE